MSFQLSVFCLKLEVILPCWVRIALMPGFGLYKKTEN